MQENRDWLDSCLRIRLSLIHTSFFFFLFVCIFLGNILKTSVKSPNWYKKHNYDYLQGEKLMVAMRIKSSSIYLTYWMMILVSLKTYFWIGNHHSRSALPYAHVLYGIFNSSSVWTCNFSSDYSLFYQDSTSVGFQEIDAWSKTTIIFY